MSLGKGTLADYRATQMNLALKALRDSGLSCEIADARTMVIRIKDPLRETGSCEYYVNQLLLHAPDLSDLSRSITYRNVPARRCAEILIQERKKARQHRYC